MFSPDYKRTIRFRHTPDDSNQSILHSCKSEFYLKNLDPYKNQFVTFKLINVKDDKKHNFAGLYVSRNCKKFESRNREASGLIDKTDLKLDFLGIERFSLDSRNNCSQNDEKKCRDNCRLQATITNYESLSEVWTFTSNVIRDLRSNEQEDLIIVSIGRPPSVKSWGNIIITLVNSVPYYPEEIDLLINEKSIQTETKENRRLEFLVYKFTIPQNTITESKPLECVLRCEAFNKRCPFELPIGSDFIIREIPVETVFKRKCARKNNSDYRIEESTMIAVLENEAPEEDLSHQESTFSANETKTTLTVESSNEFKFEENISNMEESGQIQFYFSKFNKTSNICNNYDDEEVFEDMRFFNETYDKEDELKTPEEENCVVENFNECLLMLESSAAPIFKDNLSPLNFMVEDMDDLFKVINMDKCQENIQVYASQFNPFSKSVGN